MAQPSFFDLDDRLKKLNERDPLVGLNKLIDWEKFRDTLSAIHKKIVKVMQAANRSTSF